MDQVAAFRNCSAKHGEAACVLLFESLGMEEEKVFFHCDQASHPHQTVSQACACRADVVGSYRLCSHMTITRMMLPVKFFF